MLPLNGTVAASDAFFPFPDGVEDIAKAGATAIIQPGGSVRDQEVIDAADRLGLAMIFTGVQALPALELVLRQEFLAARFGGHDSGVTCRSQAGRAAAPSAIGFARSDARDDLALG